MNSIWNKEELSDQWNENIDIPIHKKGDKTDVTAINIMHNFIEYPRLKVKSVYR
jgi:hypothetical protein